MVVLAVCENITIESAKIKSKINCLKRCSLLEVISDSVIAKPLLFKVISKELECQSPISISAFQQTNYKELISA